MKQDVPRRRFIATLGGDYALLVPPDARRGLRAGARVAVSVEPAGRSRRSSGAPPDEDEVRTIAALQAEHPDVVRRCLLAQGSMKPARARGGAGR